MLSTSRNRKHTPMTQTETIEIYAFMHHVKNGVLTISPNQGVFGQVEIPINEVSFIAVNDMPRMIALKIPVWLAKGKGLETQYYENQLGQAAPVATQKDPLIHEVDKAVNAYVDGLNLMNRKGVDEATTFLWPTNASPTVKPAPDSDTEDNHLAGYFQGYEVKESN